MITLWQFHIYRILNPCRRWPGGDAIRFSCYTSTSDGQPDIVGCASDRGFAPDLADARAGGWTVALGQQQHRSGGRAMAHQVRLLAGARAPTAGRADSSRWDAKRNAQVSGIATFEINRR